MFKFVRLKNPSGEEIAVFTGCGETGYSAKDVLTIPGAYDGCLSSDGGVPMVLSEVEQDAMVKSRCYALIIQEVTANMQDLTGDVARVASLPPTSVNSVLQTMSAGMREDVKQALDALRFYETVSTSTKVCLPEEVMVSLPKEVATSMLSARQSYVLRATENQEIFQKSCDAEFGIRLPSLDDIHQPGSGFKFSSLDILRVIMPYRRPGTPTQYEPLYHTPYFKVGAHMGMVPDYLKWLDGYASNDLLDIQPNERHMYRNMYNLYRSDVARFVAEMVTGVFLSTNYGAKLNRLRLLHDKEAIDQLVSEIHAESGFVEWEGSSYSVSCPIDVKDIDDLWARDWSPSEVGAMVKRKLQLDEGYLKAIIKSQHPAKRVVATSSLVFVLDLSEEQEQVFTDLFLEMGFMSYELHEFFLKLCQRAYEVSWGHTGSAQAISPLIYETGIPVIAKEFTAYLNAREAGKAPEPQEYMSLYRNTYSDPTLVDDDAAVNVFMASDDDDSDEVAIDFSYYITKTTAGRMMSGELDFSVLQEAHEGMDNETRTIERWRIVNGNSNLVYFLTDAYMRTADVKIYIQAFIKLLRWGDRRPKVLALQDHPEIRMVFDMCTGNECANTSIVDESELVKVNGCDYSFAGFLNSVSNRDINSAHIIGFILQKNYGTVVKQYLASWEDLAEMVASGEVNIGEFKMVSPVDASPERFVTIESFEKESYEIYESDQSIQEGLKWKVRGREMSCLFLLPRPGITEDRSYIRSTANETIMLPIDKKYDNLRRYVANLKNFYRACGDRLANIKTTVDLQELASLFKQVADAGASSKKDQNEHAASSALSRMSLDLGQSPAEIEYSTADLIGRFVLVNDGTLQSAKDDTWDKIPFSNSNLQKIASRPKTAIVLLLLKTSDCWLLCRKDISAAEVDVVVRDGARKINSESYLRLKPQIDALLDGKPATYNGMPLKLHISAKLER